MIELKLPRDWKKKRVEAIAHEVSVRNKENEELPVLSCTKYEGLVDSLKYFGRKIYSDNIENYKVVPRNSFAYATNHIEEGSIGYQDAYERALISPIYTVFETNSEIFDKYLYYLFKTELYRHIFEINTSASVDRRGSLRWTEFSQIYVPVPPLAEQKKIAEILSTWDRAIETLEKLIESKTRLKKGLMQKLLCGRTRFGGFDEQWRDCEYEEIFETVSAKKNQISKDRYMTSGKYPIVDQGQSKIVGYTDEDRVFQQVPVIVFGDHTRIIKWVDFPFVVGADGTQILKTKSLCDQKYGYYALCNLRLPNLGYSRHFKEVKESVFYIPKNTNEQKRIAMLLSSVDRELSCLNGMQEMLKDQKKGLMQKLLTGKIRVKI